MIKIYYNYSETGVEVHDQRAHKILSRLKEELKKRFEVLEPNISKESGVFTISLSLIHKIEFGVGVAGFSEEMINLINPILDSFQDDLPKILENLRS